MQEAEIRIVAPGRTILYVGGAVAPDGSPAQMPVLAGLVMRPSTTAPSRIKATLATKTPAGLAALTPEFRLEMN